MSFGNLLLHARCYNVNTHDKEKSLKNSTNDTLRKGRKLWAGGFDGRNPPRGKDGRTDP